MNFIPNVIMPYEDELLYSWITRLAQANELSLESFCGLYMDLQKEMPVDVRRGFVALYDNLSLNTSAKDLYLQTSTMLFEASVYPQSVQIRLINNIFRKESPLNLIKTYFMSAIKMCPECIKEDIEKYGEPYIHRAHQLSGVCVCHKHHTILSKYSRSDYEKRDFKDIGEHQIALDGSLQDECNYADYVYYLLKNNLQSNSNDILRLIFDAVEVEKIGKKAAANKIVDILNGYNTNTLHSRWMLNHSILQMKETIRVLMRLYPNPQDVLDKIKPYELIIEKYCDKCHRNYYITQQALNDGWDCTYCDDEIDINKLFKRIVKVAGENKYVFKGKIDVNNIKSNISLYHKECGREFLVKVNNFLFHHTRCRCNGTVLEKEAYRRMKAYPQFQLLEYTYFAGPATFLHKECGKTFVKDFRSFIETPKCVHCELQHDITQESFEQEVKNLVGDEYSVIGKVTTKSQRVDMKHNVCGRVHGFKPVEFLAGSRCEHCYQKPSEAALEKMLEQYAGNRYAIIGRDNFRIILYDNKEKKEIRLRVKHIVQEIMRPTPSIILPTDNRVKVEQPLTTWEAWYQMCKDYKEEFGHLDVQHNEKYQGKLFGDWYRMQRNAYKKGLLSEEQIKLLNDIGFVFDAVSYHWNQRFEEYKAYVNETGNYFPPINTIHNGNKVGAWFLGQRKERNRGKLNPEYEKILLEYCPDFFKERPGIEQRSSEE